MDAKPRVVILGGGAGGVTAAFYLSQGDWRARFESITIYQSGWRLGGKAASGRGEHGRIEEHGLHVWFGAYDNAFRMMRECLLELAAPPDSAVASVERAFSPCDTFVLTEATPSGWIPWIARFPRNPGMPGGSEPDVATPLPEYYRRALALLLEYVRSARRVDDRPAAEELIAPLASALELIDAVLADDRPLDRSMRTLAPALRALASVARDLLKRRIGVAARRLCYLVDITAAFINGTLEEGILSGADDWDRGLDAHDFSDWLIANGATPEAARCALVRTLCYDLPFAYRFGDPHRPTCSAATAVRGLLRVLLDYKGAIAYKPNAGMGDIMFAPLYQVLERRGVRFEFFHRVTGLRLDETETRVGAIDIIRQVSLRDTDRAYDPLVTVGGLACWPSEPILEQIAPADHAAARQPEYPDGTAVSLRDGEDFDVAVLAIPVAAHPVICEELIAARREWAEMSRRLETVCTQSLQMWLLAPSERLGFPAPGSVLGGFVEPFDTCADMSHLISQESWSNPVRSVFYFCNALPGSDQSHNGDPHEIVRRHAMTFLEHDLGRVLPGVMNRYPTCFNWDLVAGGADGPGIYWRANVEPSDRYVQSIPGSREYRLHPGESGFENLFLAGDWTSCGLDSGCIEAAITSGMVTAREIGRHPSSTEIAGIGRVRRREYVD